MPTFTYLIRTPDGIRQEGEIEAANIVDATDILRKNDQIVVKISEKDTSIDFLTPFILRFNHAMSRLKARVPLNNIVFFTRQLATMFAAGLTIERALHFLSTEEKHKKFKAVVIKLENDVKKGMQLSDALERHPGVFSNLYIALVSAGEVSGKLSETLDDLASYLETLEDTRRKVKSALYYPIFILVFLFCALLFMFTKIIPKFAEIYDQLGSALPFYTRVMTGIADWVTRNIVAVLFITFVVLLLSWLFTLTDSGRLIWDRFTMRIPIFGKMIRQSILAKFTKTFGILISAGVSVLEALGLTAKVVGNRVFELAIAQASDDIENGINISRALKDTTAFPPIMIQLISTGEETGEIDQLSLKASEFYTKQVNATIDRLTSILEPIMLLLVAMVIGMVVIATYLPIFQVGQALAQ
ncbi:MAG: type II secretion system F family protein [FCB group bacterium]|nr:type II secretion system F family protein [FCB group bacterium]